MKCDAGEIACAIDRLTNAVNAQQSGGVGWFDIVTRAVIPICLGLLTLYVAWGSQRIAKQATAATLRSQREERDNCRFRDRVELSADLRELLDARRKELLGSERGFWVKGSEPQPKKALDIRKAVESKAAVSPEVGAVDLFKRCNSAFEPVDTPEFHGSSPAQQGSLAAIRARQIEIEIRAWVRDPQEFLALIEEGDLYGEFS